MAIFNSYVSLPEGTSSFFQVERLFLGILSGPQTDVLGKSPVFHTPICEIYPTLILPDIVIPCNTPVEK